MNAHRQFLDLYNQELDYLREGGKEFARAYPKIAGRLGGLDERQIGADPFVERLLEGFAFLSARVQQKLQAEFPTFTQALLDTIYPHYLAPTPSMCIVQFEPDYDDTALAHGFTLARGSSLASSLGKGPTRCLYKTAHEVVLWPIRLVEAKYLTRDLTSLGLPQGTGAVAGLRLRFQCLGGLSCAELEMNDLVIHLAGAGKAAGRIYEQCFSHGMSLLVRPGTGPADSQTLLSPCPVEPVGFSQDESLLPFDARSPQGYRLLHEYAVFPQRYMFLRITGLRQALRKCPGNQFDLVLLFDRADPDLERVVTADLFRLFCTPAINLFEKRLDRVPVSPKQSQYHVVPERTGPLDFEVYRIQKVVGYSDKGDAVEEFTPFYQANDRPPSRPTGYFTARRIGRASRTPTPGGPLKGGQPGAADLRRQADPSRYVGSEVFLSLADNSNLPFDPAVTQLAVQALCTNRGLPASLLIERGQTQFSLAIAAPCLSVRCVGAPTLPRPAPGEDSRPWRLIHHLSHNHLALAGSSPAQAAQSLQELLRLYDSRDEPAARSEIEGIQSVECRPTVRRIVSAGCVGVVRGLTVTVTFDESAFEGASCFLLGAVLERFFAGSVSLNSFTETIIRTTERGEIKRWPKRLGTRQLL